MLPSRISFAVIFAVLGAACQGCNERSHGSAAVPISVRIDEPPPRTETPAPARPLVELTPAASARIRAIVAKEGVPEPWALRLEASWPEVCSPQHAMQFEVERPSSEDHAFESSGIKMVVHRRQVEMLRGTEIHFGEKGGQTGFIITTPNFKGEALEKWGPVLRSDPLSAPRHEADREQAP
jgi:Fe-S cluster assembly iron-binding protein IscA